MDDNMFFFLLEQTPGIISTNCESHRLKYLSQNNHNLHLSFPFYLHDTRCLVFVHERLLVFTYHMSNVQFLEARNVDSKLFVM